MRAPNSSMKAAESRNWCSRWLGSKLIPNAGAVADRRERLARGQEVVGDLGRVDLEREAHALGLEDVDDRAPLLRERLVAALDLVEVVGRERVEHVPDRRAGEARDHVDAELRGGAGGVLHPLGGALLHAGGVAVAPDLGRQRRPGAGRRSGRRRPGPSRWLPIAQTPRPCRASRSRCRLRVAGVGERPRDVEVVAPAGQLEPVEAPRAALGGEVGDGQVGPLAREQRDGTAHAAAPACTTRSTTSGASTCSMTMIAAPTTPARSPSRLAHDRAARRSPAAASAGTSPRARRRAAARAPRRGRRR